MASLAFIQRYKIYYQLASPSVLLPYRGTQVPVKKHLHRVTKIVNLRTHGHHRSAR